MVDIPDDGGYLLGNQQVEAGTCFDALALFDPSTLRHIETLGLQLAEVGAGGPSVASWLAARVGRRVCACHRYRRLVDNRG
jgi:hypothetical protein